jgi:hypothetical protein
METFLVTPRDYFASTGITARGNALELSRPATTIGAPRTQSAFASSPAGFSRVDPAGGDQHAGLIRGVAVATLGEAVGYGRWIDSYFLNQVAGAINASSGGVKSRFAHPSQTDDGLGKYLGRMKNAKIDGDTVRADQHFATSAHKTPSGDLAEYAMNLATEDAAAMGASVAFERDTAAENAFMAQHGGPHDFESPDENNVENLPHVRLKQLRAVDLVDTPAANPSGMFKGRVETLTTAEPKATIEADAASPRQRFAAGLAEQFRNMRATAPAENREPAKTVALGNPLPATLARFAASVKLPTHAKPGDGQPDFAAGALTPGLAKFAAGIKLPAAK